MPSRIIRDGCLDSERVDALSEQAENFYKRLLNIVDDYGRCEANPVALLAKTYPLRVARYSPEQVEGWLRECRVGDEPLVTVYQVGRKRYLQVNDFRQRVRTDSKYPDPALGVVEPAGGHLTDKCQTNAGLARATPTNTNTNTNTNTRPSVDTDETQTREEQRASEVGVEARSSNVLQMRRPPQMETQPLRAGVAVNGEVGVSRLQFGKVVTGAPGAARGQTANSELWAEAAYMLHPKKRKKGESLAALWGIYCDSTKKRLFEKNHPAWCETEDWTKENARFCPPLDEWIQNDGYTSGPTCPKESCGYEVPEL